MSQEADASPQLGDMPPEEFRHHAREAVDWVADFLKQVDEVPVFPAMRPGDITAALPDAPPEQPESMDALLSDFRSIIVPGINHWNHPSFFGYFSVSASGPGIIGELLASALNVNAMVWRSAPAASELEDVATDWLRQLLRLPRDFEGVINDTASSSTMYALAAAREVTWPEAHAEGMFGLPRGRVYASEHAHSSVEKGVLTLGLGQEGYCTIPSDAGFSMDPVELDAAIRSDRDAGLRPCAIVATLGTTSTASMDPIGPIAEIAAQHGVWLHIDAAYGGPVAMLPEAEPWFEGWERADSIVVNPHKWLFTPIDCSVLYCRRPEVLRQAFSLVPEYLRSSEQAESRSLMDYGVSLGRRFRALKLWFVIRYFGRQGLIDRIREHLRIASVLSDMIEATDGWEVVAPVDMGLVTFRRTTGTSGEDQDRLNHAILDAVNASGRAFMTHTVLEGRVVLRLAIGNIKTTEQHVMRTWSLLQVVANEIH
jgi:aromatic-L-amino-acid decarboxylase